MVAVLHFMSVLFTLLLAGAVQVAVDHLLMFLMVDFLFLVKETMAVVETIVTTAQAVAVVAVVL
jgi:hypothetical protein